MVVAVFHHCSVVGGGEGTDADPLVTLYSPAGVTTSGVMCPQQSGLRTCPSVSVYLWLFLASAGQASNPIISTGLNLLISAKPSSFLQEEFQ